MGTHPIFESDFDCLTATLTRVLPRTEVKMPGVQGKYTIDVTNRFGLAVDEDDQEVESDVENVDPFEIINQANKQAEVAKAAPKQKGQKKKAAPAKPAVVEEKKEDNKRPERRRDGRGRGRGGPRGERRPRREGEDGAPERADGDRPRRGGGRGRGRGRRSDRKSGDPRTTVKGTESRGGAGQGNWGTTEDELKGQTEQPSNEENNEEAKAAEQTEEAAKPEPVPAEPEDKTMTLEEYRKQKVSVHRNPNAKVEEEKEAEKKPAAKKQPAGKKVISGFSGHQRQQRDGDRRQNNRRGGDRQARGDNNNAKKANAEFNLAEDFPTLG